LSAQAFLSSLIGIYILFSAVNKRGDINNAQNREKNTAVQDPVSGTEKKYSQGNQETEDAQIELKPFHISEPRSDCDS
jgi:hypothetical protein